MYEKKNKEKDKNNMGNMYKVINEGTKQIATKK